MKNLFFLCCFLGVATQVSAQLPSNSYVVTSACPGSANNPSTLEIVNTDGSLTRIGSITDGSTGIVVNGLGYDQANRTVLYAMRVVPPTFASITNNTPPDLYQIDLATGAATNIGPMTAPPTPITGLTQPAAGESTMDLRQTLNFVGDSGPDAAYYVGGATFRILYQTFFGLPLFNTARVTDVRLYVGTVNLKAIAAPVWKQLDTSDPTTAAIVETQRVQTEAYVRSMFAGSLPEGGIQDWVYDKSNGNLVSYIGQSGQYLTVVNPASAPVATTTTPAVPLPPLPTSSTDFNIGSMFSDKFNNVYVVRAGSGEIFRVDNLTGDYSGKTFGSALGCNRGDAVSFPDALPLPVTLTRFEAQASGSAVRLNWATASEQQADYFAVERSATGRSWQPVARVAAGNQSNGQQYTALDARPLSGLAYYRLAMHDRDGKVAYSSVQTVTQNATLTVYPNPASALVNVVLASGQEGAVLELLTAQGQMVRRLKTPTGTNHASLRIAGLPGGVYLLRVRQAGVTSTSRLMVLEQ